MRMMHRRMAFGMALCCAAAGFAPSSARPPVPAQEAPPVVSQETLGPNACGPCAIVNGLLHAKPPTRELLGRIEGDTSLEKARGLIRRFLREPSEAYGPDAPRYNEKSGMAGVDLAASFNDLLKEAGSPGLLEGTYLDRRSGEGLDAHLRRIRGLLSASIRQGMPVVVSLRSFAPGWNEEKKEYQWKGLVGHFVAVTDVQGELGAGEKGFRFTYADSFTGKMETGYAWYDEARNFTAAKGDEKKWEWVTDRPFLLVTAPSLRLGTQDQPWFLRTTVILNYAVFRPE